MQPNSVLLSLPYFGPISWYSEFIRADEIAIEACENFQKQSFRNRTYIVDPNRVLPLVVPIVHQPGNSRQRYSEVKISYAANWQKDHWKALESSYRSSPYFEFYEDFFRPLFQHPEFELLMEFNKKAHTTIVQLLDLADKTVSWTQSYASEFVGKDLREVIHPKKSFGLNMKPSYHQVFSPENSLHPNISVLDLLFNVGPQARQILLGFS